MLVTSPTLYTLAVDESAYQQRLDHDEVDAQETEKDLEAEPSSEGHAHEEAASRDAQVEEDGGVARIEALCECAESINH